MMIQSRKPDPEPDPDPEPEPEPTPEPIIEPEPTEPVLIECPDGSQVENVEDCPGPSVALAPEPGLPLCDGSPQTCITEAGIICEVGQASHECECAEDMSDCPMHPGIVDPETKPKKPLPYCDTPEGEAATTCHDRYDFDEDTGLYPCNDGTQATDPLECNDVYVPEPPGGFCQALGCPGSPPDPETGCFDGRDPVNGMCPIPDPKPDPNSPCDPETDENCEQVHCPAVIGTDCKPYQCKEGYELVNGKCEKEVEERHKVIIKKINIYKTIHNSVDFPDVDIIGLSIKDNGDAMVCMMNIDNDWVQCQQFGVPNDRINENIWRIIETDSNNDYDNANTGSEDVDDAINGIKSFDFPELDDLDNHDFNVDLAALGINPQGDGLICLIEDDRNEGTALCEPFKVSNQAISGQITEITEISS